MLFIAKTNFDTTDNIVQLILLYNISYFCASGVDSMRLIDIKIIYKKKKKV